MNFYQDITLLELQNFTDQQLNRCMVFAERNLSRSYQAECTYWMCIMEINRRNNGPVPDYLDMKCIHNIFNTNHEFIFRLGNKYRLYEIDNTLLMFNDDWHPYIFTAVEEDNRCVWKYFSLWEYGVGEMYYDQ